jgi:hypothetical protein
MPQPVQTTRLMCSCWQTVPPSNRHCAGKKSRRTPQTQVDKEGRKHRGLLCTPRGPLCAVEKIPLSRGGRGRKLVLLLFKALGLNTSRLDNQFYRFAQARGSQIGFRTFTKPFQCRRVHFFHPAA